MLCDALCESDETLWVDEILVEFSFAYEGIQVSPCTFRAMLRFHGHSLGIMVTSLALGTSAVGEMFWLTSSPSFQRQTLFQDIK